MGLWYDIKYTLMYLGGKLRKVYYPSEISKDATLHISIKFLHNNIYEL